MRESYYGLPAKNLEKIFRETKDVKTKDALKAQTCKNSPTQTNKISINFPELSQ